MCTSVSVPDFKYIDYPALGIAGSQPDDSHMAWFPAGFESLWPWNLYSVTLIWKQIFGTVIFSISSHAHLIITGAGNSTHLYDWHFSEIIKMHLRSSNV